MRIYFSGIGGVGIGPLAEIAHDAGYQVIGSDVHRSALTSQLSDRGVQISYSQDGQSLKSAYEQAPIDWLVYTAALPANHPELVMARQLGIKTAKRDELLAKIITAKNLKLIAISGTHGKTSTTSMLIWTLKQLGIPISYSVGAPLSFGPSGLYDPKSQYFIYECDEFDRNFLHFWPELSLVTSIDYDHIDTFPSQDDYQQAFRQFIDQSQATIMWRWDAKAIKAQPVNSWLLSPGDQPEGLELAGVHVRQNATLVLKALEKLALSQPEALSALNSYPGAGRRFEKLASNLYSDYAHHPKEIKATLQQASELSSSVVLVYQPHQNRRQHEIIDQYTEAIFQNAQTIYWLPTFLSRESPNQVVLSPKELVRLLPSDKIRFGELNDQLFAKINQHRDNGEMVLLMGAGDIDSWIREKL